MVCGMLWILGIVGNRQCDAVTGSSNFLVAERLVDSREKCANGNVGAASNLVSEFGKGRGLEP